MLVQMHMTNERYQQNTTATSDWLDLRWQLGFHWHRRGIELVLQVPRLFHNATVSQCNHFFCCYICTCICLKLHQADYQVGEVFFTSILVGGTQLQCIYYLCPILISRPPRVFRRFKRRSCNDLATQGARASAAVILAVCLKCFSLSTRRLKG